MPKVLGTLAALAVVLVSCSAASSPDPATGSPAATQPPARPSPSVTELPTAHTDGPARTSPVVTAADLMEIVVQPSAPPAGLRHDDTGVGTVALSSQLYSERALGLVAERVQPAFVAGRYSTFSGEAGALLSLALLFASSDAATAAYEIYADELEAEEGYGLGPGSDAQLGDGGLRYEGEVERLGGLHEIIYLWRNGPLLLVAGGPLDDATLRAVADGIDARVTRTSHR